MFIKMMVHSFETHYNFVFDLCRSHEESANHRSLFYCLFIICVCIYNNSSKEARQYTLFYLNASWAKTISADWTSLCLSPIDGHTQYLFEYIRIFILLFLLVQFCHLRCGTWSYRILSCNLVTPFPSSNFISDLLGVPPHPFLQPS